MSASLTAKAVVSAQSFIKTKLREGHYGLSCQGTDGTPRFPDNKGHVFVGYFIAEALAGIMDEVERTILLVRILSEENEGTWGFSSPAPFVSDHHRVFLVDADDTAYVLRTLRRLGAFRPPVSLLRFHREAHSAFLTFDGPGPATLTANHSPANNLLAHPEVNANVFLALQGTNYTGFINYDLLLSAQDPTGPWMSYFYPGPYFATSLVLDLLQEHPQFSDVSARALQFTLDNQGTDGSWGQDDDPYESALALATLVAGQADRHRVEKGLRHLVQLLEPDGSWRTNSCVWEFPASDDDVWQAFDRHGTFTTAVCTMAVRGAAALLATR